MNSSRQDAAFSYCCVCAGLVVDLDGACTCTLCGLICHANCICKTMILSFDSRICKQCSLNLDTSDVDLPHSPIDSNASKLYKPIRLQLIESDDSNKPLLNNKDLDPDPNYLSDFNKDSPYLAPSHLSLKFINTSHSFTIMHLNCRSIASKLNEIQILLQQLPTSILAVTETWLSDSTADSIYIPNYTFTYKNRSEVGGGGCGCFC